MVPWANPSPHPKRHLDWFSHFCRAHDYDRQINQETDHASLSVTIGHIYIVLWCGLKVLTVLPETVSDAELIDPGMIDETDDSGWNLICSSCIALNNTTSVSLHLNVQSISPVYTIQPVVKPVWQLGKTFVYTIQPVVKPVDKPVWQTAVLCIQPVVKPVVQPGLTTGGTNSGCSFNTVVKPVWQPCWMFVCTIQPVVKPVVQPRLYRVNGVIPSLRLGWIV